MARLITIREGISPVDQVASFEKLVEVVVARQQFHLLEQPDGTWRPVYWCQKVRDFVEYSAHVPSTKGPAEAKMPYKKVGYPVQTGEVNADLRSILNRVVEEGSIRFEFFLGMRCVLYKTLDDNDSIKSVILACSEALKYYSPENLSWDDQDNEEFELLLLDKTLEATDEVVGLFFPNKQPAELADLLPTIKLPAPLHFVQTQVGAYYGEGVAYTVNDLLKTFVEYRQIVFMNADKAFTIDMQKIGGAYRRLADMLHYLYV